MPVELEVFYNDALTVAQRDLLLARLRAAWNDLPPETQAALKPTLDEAHIQLQQLLADGTPPSGHTQQTLRMKSYLTGDWDGHLAQLGQPLNQAATQPLAEPILSHAIRTEAAIKVGPDGEILGTGKYQQLDPRWELVAGTVWLEHILHKQPFPPGTPPIHTMPDIASFALVGDFGTGNFGAGESPSVKISKFIPGLRPGYTIHLGDVYYAGTAAEESGNLLALWPEGTVASFALNSNHDMYSSGGPYFNQVLGDPVFNRLQSPWSFFALENSHWIVVGLDSAYYASPLKLYLNGTLGKDNAQRAFLSGIAARGKKVIVLTHHNGIPVGGFDPASPLELYTDVMEAFAGHPPPAFWYWGHEHVGAAYAELENGTLCRCLGHGALPWGFASSLRDAGGKVQWFEQRSANDPANTLRVLNGFVHLELNGPDLTETFYDENGGIAWRRVARGA